MLQNRRGLFAVVTGLVVVAFALPASAQNIRTYGDDSSESGGSGGGGGSQSQSGGQKVCPSGLTRRATCSPPTPLICQRRPRSSRTTAPTKAPATG